MVRGRNRTSKGDETMSKGAVRLVVLAVFLLAPSLILFPGCGSSRTDEDGEAAVEEAVAEEEATGGGEEGEDDADRAPAGGEAEGFGLETQEIGSRDPLHYLKLADVRWSDHGDYFRLVAELKRGDWMDTEDIPWCFSDYPEEEREPVQTWEEIRLYINGIRHEDIHVSLSPGEGVETGDPVVYQVLMGTTYSVDGTPSVSLFCSTHGQKMHRLSYATDPMRIILDILK